MQMTNFITMVHPVVSHIIITGTILAIILITGWLYSGMSREWKKQKDNKKQN